MVYLLAGPKGTGKTQQMIEQANEAAKKCNGNVVFIKKTHRDTASVTFDIRTICMDDFPAITNIDEYIGFLYGNGQGVKQDFKKDLLKIKKNLSDLDSEAKSYSATFIKSEFTKKPHKIFLEISNKKLD